MTSPYIHARALASSRQRPEDAAEVFERGDILVAVLADGSGGIRGGEAASRSLVAIAKSAVDDAAFAVGDVRAWIELFQTTDAALSADGTGQTTGVVVVLGPRGLIGVSTGDSEAWVVKASQVDNLTVGQRTKERLGGTGATLTTFERPPLAGVLLIATDGLFKFASNDVIARIVRASPVGVAAEGLIDLVRHPKGNLADDVAVILVARPLPV